MRRSAIVVSLLASVALLVGACSDKKPEHNSVSATQGGQGAHFGGKLVDLQNFATGGEPDHIDPALASTVQGSQPGQLLFEGLTKADYATGELKPAVAESWKSNPDFTEWTFKLRKGVTFSDGEPVLPSDFKYAWERVVNPDLASEVSYHVTDNLKVTGAKDVADGKAQEMSGLVADDPNLTLTIHLDEPLSFLPSVVSHLVFSPVPKKVVSALPKHGVNWEQGVMIGDGSYKMAEPWKHDQYIRLERNDKYYGGIHNHKAYIDTIEFRISKDIDSGFAAFEAGEGQTGYIPPGRVTEAKSKYAGRISVKPFNGIYYWGFNMKDAEVGGPQNLKLRQAISLAINKKQIVDTVYNGARQVATGWTPPVMPGYKQGLSNFPDRDLAKAKDLLAQWEHDTGKKAAQLAPIKLNFNAGAGHEPVATIIQANLNDIGVKSVLDPRDTKTYFSQMRKGQGQFLRAGWVADYSVYDNMLFPVFGSSQIGTGDNLVQYSNPKFDGLIDQARRAANEDARDKLYQQAEQIVLNDDTAVVPLNWYTGLVVWSPQLHNVVQSSLDFFDYDEMWLK
jgi:ABC-type transport system substrate-binding protein